MNTLDSFISLFFFIIYSILWIIKRYECKKNYNIEVNVLNSSIKPIQIYFNQLQNIMKVLLIIIILIHLINIRTFTFTTQFFELNFVGITTSIIGLLIIRVAQVTIDKSWRVGIDFKSNTTLITHGIYSKIRNPTYTGLFILCIGVFIILPTYSILFWILSFFIMMEFQVRCEEEFLENKFKDEYFQYFKKTKRYLPFIY